MKTLFIKKTLFTQLFEIKAPTSGAFFIGLRSFVGRIGRLPRTVSLFVLYPAALWAADDCALTASQRDTTTLVSVAQVIDGDTLRLTDRRLVRLVGINAPEIDHETGNSQPYAEQARDYVKGLLRNQIQVRLLPDEDRKDRYGRELAHVYFPNGENLEAKILRQGYAMALVIPPNLQNITCYREAELTASKARRGLWSDRAYRPRDAATLNRNDSGFHLITGTVSRIGESKKSLWLELGNKAALRINKKDLHYFQSLDPKTLLHQKLVVRGWLRPYKERMIMQLRHPVALDIQPQ